jgi:hypothetical protein
MPMGRDGGIGMGYDTSPPFGPIWFRIMFPGIVAGFLALTFGVVLATHPGQPSLGLLALGMGLLVLGILAALFIGAGLFVGARVRFRWRGWREDETRREEAAKRLADRVFAPLWKRVNKVPPKTGKK